MENARVLIVGGGFAGLAAARALRRAHAEVVLLDKHNHHLFQPLLYQVATAALSPGNIAAPIRHVLSRQKNCQVYMGEVTDIDTQRQTVVLGAETIAYDYLVLATGARTNYFGNDDWAKHAPGLKTIDEAINIRRRFLLAFEEAEMEADPAARRAALTFAIVGAGPTGVELAGALIEISRHTIRSDFRHFDSDTVRVILIDRGDRVLHGFGDKLSASAQQTLEKLGIEVMLDTPVVEVDERGLTIERNGGRERIDANNVVWAAGVRASDLGAKLGQEVDRSGRVHVQDDLTTPAHANVFVVGDVAFKVNAVSGQPVPGVAQGAMQMGKYAGQTIAREIAARNRGRELPARKPFQFHDKGSMAIIGKNLAVADVFGYRFAGRLAFLAWALLHIFFLIGFRRKLTTFAEWTFMYLFYERGVRLITGEGARPKLFKTPLDPRLAQRNEPLTARHS